jgi:hypothetical protein
MFFITEERFTLALVEDRFERPFEFLLSPDNVLTSFPETISTIVQLLVPRRVSVCQRIEDVLTMCHELIVTHDAFPWQNWQPILPKLVTKCSVIFLSHCTTHVLVDVGKLHFAVVATTHHYVLLLILLVIVRQCSLP